MFFVAVNAAHADSLPAFPGAEGNGSTTPGGRGGAIYLVTSLDDSGPGSLRSACEADGPRMAIIDTSGTIELESPIEIHNSFITIAGQRAPGFGVCLKNHGLQVSANDVVVRYLRIRPGSGTGIAIANSERVVIDHCSIEWTTGSAISITGASRDVTVQWSIAAESIADGSDAKGVTIGIDDGAISLHHNFLAHHPRGFPFVNGNGDEPGPLIDFRNNVLYDWSENGVELGEGFARMNLLNNSFKSGPSRRRDVPAKAIRSHSTDNRFYIETNDLIGSALGSGSNFLMIHLPDEFTTRQHREMLKTDGPFDTAPVTTAGAADALSRVLAQAGTVRPRRDSVDERVIAQYRLGGGTIPTDPSQTGGWPQYIAAEPLPDSDADGMPDDWETNHELNPSDSSDARADRDNDRYTNIEEYLNSTTVLHPESR